MKEVSLSGAAVRRMMRLGGHTIVGLAQHMNVTQARVRHVREHGVKGDAFVRDWVEALLYKPVNALTLLIREVVAEDFKDDPSLAWAGECGIFADIVLRLAEERAITGVKTEGIYHTLAECECALQAPPGLTLKEVESLGIAADLDHVWLVRGDLHYDAASPEGVGSPFDLRCLRQSMVETLQRENLAKLNDLCDHNSWWVESVRLSSEFSQARQEVSATRMRAGAPA